MSLSRADHHPQRQILSRREGEPVIFPGGKRGVRQFNCYRIVIALRPDLLRRKVLQLQQLPPEPGLCLLPVCGLLQNLCGPRQNHIPDLELERLILLGIRICQNMQAHHFLRQLILGPQGHAARYEKNRQAQQQRNFQNMKFSAVRTLYSYRFHQISVLCM